MSRQVASEAVHAINQLESGGRRKGRRGADILLVPAYRKRFKGPVSMVLCSTDTRNARCQLEWEATRKRAALLVG